MANTPLYCPVCTAPLMFNFNQQLLGRYSVDYFECVSCALVRTENPYWLTEAYSSAIADMDTGLVQRNIEMSMVVSQIIEKNFDQQGVFLDYAGGYGLFVRLMRDKGFDFYWEDKFCENIFARFFSRLESVAQYEIVTAFEFFEHVTDPMAEAKRMAALTDNILFSTEIRPVDDEKLRTWWYLVPETGQHIVFYSIKTLQILSQQLDMYLYTNGRNLHMMSKRRDLDIFTQASTAKVGFVEKVVRRFRNKKRVSCNKKQKIESLTWSDHLKIRELLKNKRST
jgi:hypothetical protein